MKTLGTVIRWERGKISKKFRHTQHRYYYHVSNINISKYQNYFTNTIMKLFNIFHLPSKVYIKI